MSSYWLVNLLKLTAQPCNMNQVPSLPASPASSSAATSIVLTTGGQEGSGASAGVAAAVAVGLVLAVVVVIMVYSHCM